MRDKVEQNLEILTAVETGGTVSQATLSRRIGIAVGLVNALLRRSVRKGYVKVSQAPARRYAYYLTPKGLAEKSRLVGAYLDYSLSFFRQARGEYLEILQRAAMVGRRRAVLIGGGELAEIALLSAREAGVEIVAVVAADRKSAAALGLPVHATIDAVEAVELAILTTRENAQQYYDQLVAELGHDRVAAPPFLRVVRAAADGRAGRSGSRAA